MKAVIAKIPDSLLAWRSRTGADRWDEKWEGVLHMPPMPNRDHQNFEWSLETYLRLRWARPRGCKVFHQINLSSPGGWPDDYRIPDLVLLTPDRFDVDRNEYFEGPPSAVVEIRSPDDESYEKLEFYARLGVPEVWIIDRDTKRPEVFALSGDRYEGRPPGDSGWVKSDVAGVEMRATEAAKLAIRLAGDPSTVEELPPE